MKRPFDEPEQPAGPTPEPEAQGAPGITRRGALLTGAAGLMAGVGLSNHGAAQVGENAASTPVGRHARSLRNTRNDAWRRKVARGSSLERHLESVERIDPEKPLPPGLPGRDYTPVITPNNVSLPFKIVDGVKVFHLVAEEVKHRFAEGLEAYC
jgi:manganese oxidase